MFCPVVLCRPAGISYLARMAGRVPQLGTAFMEFYASRWGDRWPTLLKAMTAPPKHVARVNPFLSECERSVVKRMLEGLPGCHQLQPDTGTRAPLLTCYLGPSAFPNPATVEGQGEAEGEGGQLRGYYLMDLASIIAAVVLDVRPGHRVADFCAAPGGKALILAEQMGEEGMLLCNDRSADRKARLLRTIKDYLPPLVRRRVHVLSRDASKFGQGSEVFDRILVDAPCSSERHLLQPDGHSFLSDWKPQRSKRLGTEQRALLSSAIRCLSPGGRVVYSTCSISDLENDGVLSKILRRNANVARPLTSLHQLPPHIADFLHAALSIRDLGGENDTGSGKGSGEGRDGHENGGKEEGLVLERTEFGWQILPDVSGGWGPIYFAVVERVG